MSVLLSILLGEHGLGSAPERVIRGRIAMAAHVESNKRHLSSEGGCHLSLSDGITGAGEQGL